MAQTKHPLSQEEFDYIFAKVPRLTVEVLVNTPEGVVMAQIPKGVFRGKWNMPGGTVRLSEPLIEAVKRVARSELGIEVEVGDNVGYIEYPELPKAGYKGWPVGMVFEARMLGGELTNGDEGEAVRCFKSVPPNTIESQAKFLHEYLSRRESVG